LYERKGGRGQDSAITFTISFLVNENENENENEKHQINEKFSLNFCCSRYIGNPLKLPSSKRK
jgi:hypothetical protein